MSEISLTWFEEAKKLNVGQAIFIRVANKKEQTKLANEFEEDKEEWSRIEPILASQIFVAKTLMDRKLYVVLERKFRTIFTAFFKDVDGKFSKLSIDPERKRIIQLMLKDEKCRDEIEAVLNGLTEEERKEFFYEED